MRNSVEFKGEIRATVSDIIAATGNAPNSEPWLQVSVQRTGNPIAGSIAQEASNRLIAVLEGGIHAIPMPAREAFGALGRLSRQGSVLQRRKFPQLLCEVIEEDLHDGTIHAAKISDFGCMAQLLAYRSELSRSLPHIKYTGQAPVYFIIRLCLLFAPTHHAVFAM